MIFAWLLVFAMQAQAAFEVPPLREPVQDEVGIIGTRDRREIEQWIRAADATGHIQLQVYVIPSLQGETIEQVSIRIVDQWKLGDAKRDNGVLFLIATQDRRMRIEVGQGLEGDIPDVVANRIINETVTPHFRANDMSAGVREGVIRILHAAGASAGTVAPQGTFEGRDFNFWAHLIGFILLIFFSITMGGGRRRGGNMAAGILLGSLGRGGGWGGSSGGGGGRGWGGGGGGFSGGGASGGW